MSDMVVKPPDSGYFSPLDDIRDNFDFDEQRAVAASPVPPQQFRSFEEPAAIPVTTNQELPLALPLNESAIYRRRKALSAPQLLNPDNPIADISRAFICRSCSAPMSETRNACVQADLPPPMVVAADMADANEAEGDELNGPDMVPQQQALPNGPGGPLPDVIGAAANHMQLLANGIAGGHGHGQEQAVHRTAMTLRSIGDAVDRAYGYGTAGINRDSPDNLLTQVLSIAVVTAVAVAGYYVFRHFRVL